jgi:hypothetical protein
MKLTEAQSRALLAKHGVYVTEACDKCGKILGHVRFTRYGEKGEWCSRECRDGAQSAEQYRTTRKAGRPAKYRSEHARKAAIRLQKADWQRNERKRLSVEKNHLVSDSFHVSSRPEKQALAIPLAWNLENRPERL